MRFVIRMGYDMKTFTAAIVNMATAGYLTIENNKDEFTLKKNKKTNVTLPQEEAQIAAVLFENNDSIALAQKNHTVIKDAQSKFKFILKENFKNKYFVTNSDYLIFGIG